MSDEQKSESQVPDEPAGSAVSTAPQLPDVMVTVSMELGRTQATLDELLNYGDQSMIELERMVGEPIDIMLNGKLFARGEVVTVGENFGVRVAELVGGEMPS